MPPQENQNVHDVCLTFCDFRLSLEKPANMFSETKKPWLKMRKIKSINVTCTNALII